MPKIIEPAPFTASSRLTFADGVTTAEAGGVTITIGPKPGSDQGPTPVELLVAAVASCLALSLRGAANLAHLADRLTSVDVAVTGIKAHGLPSRLETIEAVLSIEGDLDTEQKQALVEHAERLCTVSNTLLSETVRVHATLGH